MPREMGGHEVLGQNRGPSSPHVRQGREGFPSYPSAL